MEIKTGDDGETLTLSCERPIKGVILDVEDRSSDVEVGEVKWSDQAIDMMPGDDQTVVAKGLKGRKVKARVSRDEMFVLAPGVDESLFCSSLAMVPHDRKEHMKSWEKLEFVLLALLGNWGHKVYQSEHLQRENLDVASRALLQTRVVTAKSTKHLDAVDRQLLHLSQRRFHLSVELSVGVFVSDVFGKVALNACELGVSFFCKFELTSHHGLERRVQVG